MGETSSCPASTWPASAISSLNEGLIYDLLCFRFVFLWPMLRVIGHKAKVWIIVGKLLPSPSQRASARLTIAATVLYIVYTI